MNIRFSIIIPCYNVEKYIEECLESILSQEEQSWEAICVDDGSTDGSGAILDEYAARDKRFKVVHKRNGGEGSARNAGLDVARGEWICYLDSDDIWHRCFLEDVKLAIDRHVGVDMASVLQQTFHDGEECDWGNGRTSAIQVFDTSMSLHSRLFMIGVWSTAYRRRVYGDLRFTDHCLGADRVYTMRCLVRSQIAAVTENRDYGYRVRENSMAHNEWSLRKIRSAIDFSRECVFEIAGCGKKVDKGVSRSLCSIWLERNAALIAKVKDSQMRNELLAQWLNGIEINGKSRFYSPWYRCVCSVLKFTRRIGYLSRACALILCVFPYKLKTLGFHR